ncbi:MAG: CDP-diacylglycerol--serine O-phosphatidyltransferase [Deltaproteobacteria bacterium CG1_02_45_11]|nr:MAG: CDP-diacylglycerol--serine O-phosphatidyltransferase [Deltaproteobacteria bacterium CG1_02_45_11]
MKRKKRFKKDSRRRGIYILPNIFTSLNIFCGFYAVISSINGSFAAAAISVILAVVFDALDGKIARATNTTSRFGVEYDSLADLISFGLAPGVMMYLWALKPLGRIGWLAAFLFMVCGALRLARFNTYVGTQSGAYFTGLPIPAAAGMVATTVLFCKRFGIAGNANPAVLLVMLYMLAFLMVSYIKYNSFKEKPELFRRMNFNVLVAVILILIFVAAQPSIALFLLGLAYVISGPLTTIRRYMNARHSKAAASELDKPKSSPV